MIKEVLSDALGILKIPTRENEIPFDARLWIDKKIYKVENYVGLAKKDIKNSVNYQIIIRGNGDTILSQMPEAGESIIEGGTIILYT